MDLKLVFDEIGKALQSARERLGGGESVYEFSFTELSDGSAKFIDGMAAGKFTTMSGQEVTLKAEDFPSFVENTQSLIDSTKTEGGDVVGLPIDMDDHDFKGGAGWIVGLELDEARKVIRFAVKWTKEGLSAIKENIRRFFSPTLDPVKKTILGGSLTNWPASRDKNWHMKLRPIELSQQIKEIDMKKSLKAMQDELARLQGQIESLAAKEKETDTPGSNEEDEDDDSDQPVVISKELQKLLNTPEGVVEIARRTGMQVDQAVKLQRRVTKVTQFAAELTTGTADQPYGAKISAPKIVTVLLSLPESQSEAVMEMMKDMWSGVIDFAERGFGMAEFVNGKPLPKEIVESANSWVEGGKDIREFVRVNADVLGDAKQYNLAPYILRGQELEKAKDD